MRLVYYTILLLALCFIIQGSYYYPKLPATVASHFGASGEANGWAPKSSLYVALYSVIPVLMVMFVGLPRLLRFIPTSMINVPHREYWLSPQKRQETFGKIAGYIAGFGVLTLSMLLTVIQCTIQANMDGTHRLPMPGFLVVLFGYIAAVVVWLVAFFSAFRMRSAA